MRRKHHRGYQGCFTRLASRYRSLFTLVWTFLALLSVPGFNGFAHAQSATYRVTFEGKFTASALASGVSVPSGEHFTTLIGAVHNADVTFLREGGMASAGIESMAEIGGTSTLKSEINAAMPNALAVIEQSIASGGTATATVDITLTTDHPLVTLTSMVAPSPDWFVGVSGLSLLDAQGDWLAAHMVDLFPYDAGTEEGTEFSLSNAATSPQGTITSIKGTGKFSDEPIANLTFTLQAVTPEITSATTFTVDEGTTAVETLTAKDQDTAETDLTWSIPTAGGADAGQFMLSTAGDLAFAAAPDYENPDDADGDNVYEVTVQVREGTNTATADIEVTVVNVDEAGSVSLFPALLQVRTVVRPTLSDPDGGISAVAWQWARSSDKMTWADIDRAVRADYLPTDSDQGQYLRATASYTDGEGADKTAVAASEAMVGKREPGPELSVKTLVSGLKHPWGIAFLPDETMLFGERDEKLMVRLTDGTVRDLTADLSDRNLDHNNGLMGIVVDPDFTTNRRFYTCMSHTGSVVQVIVWELDATYTTATRVVDPLVDGIPSGRNHNGCRLRFGPDGYLWISTGDTEVIGTTPQDLDSLGGKVLRVNAAGVPPADNPFSDSPVYSYGHRNPQGLALRPGTRQMWVVEHGPDWDDEINLLASGANYGWEPVPTNEMGEPQAGYDDTRPMTDLLKFPSAVEARWSSGYPTIATSGAIFLEGERWGIWEGRLAVATLKNRSLHLFEFSEDGNVLSHVIPPELDHTHDRLRTPMLGPDDALYISTSNGRDRDLILRLTPQQAPEFASDTAAFEVPENTDGTTPVATVEATDYNHDELTYTLGGTDVKSFYILDENIGELRVPSTTQLDYETKQTYEVTVTATDDQNTSDTVTLTIEVTDVDEAGTVSLPPDPPQALTPLTARLDDPDRDAGHTVSWQWASSANRTGPWTAIGGATAPSYTPQASDVTKYLRATATYQDRHARNQSAFSDASAQVTAHAQSVAPEITSETTFTVDEGTTAVETLTAEDQDTAAADLEWSKAGGADADDFTLSTDGDLAFAAAPDYENPGDADGDNVYEVTVQVSDGDDTDTADIRVTLQNVIELLTQLTGPSSTDYAENGAVRVAAYTASSEADRDGIAWSLGGDDAGHFSIDNPAGVLRFHIDPDDDNSFPKLPDYEAPDDKDEKNDYEVIVLARSGSALTLKSVVVTVTDENEAGAISLTTARPRLGAPLTATPSDPDEGSGLTVTAWKWERSAGRNTWVVIDGAEAASYTPTAADAGSFLRVTAAYTDSHDDGQSAQAVSAEVVTAELLKSLTVTTNTSTADPDKWAMRPEFSADILHYAIGCADDDDPDTPTDDTMTLTPSAGAAVRLAVNGVQVASGSAIEVPVDGDSEVPITLATGSNGTSTTYVVHCMDSRNPAIERTIKEPGASTELISISAQDEPTRNVVRATYLAIIDANGVPRWQQRLPNSRTVHFKVHPDGKYPYSYGEAPEIVILDENLDVVERVTTTDDLQHTGTHDFVIRENGNYVFEAYEPAIRDFSAYTDENGDPYGTSENTSDSVIEEVNPAGSRVFFWNSWDDMYLNDCLQHRFPIDYAHINSVQVVDEADIIASFRGCSQVWRIDRETGAGEWLLGRSNRSDAEWEAHGIRTLKIVGDPHGEFCGQHSARLIPNGHLLLFDNGNHCLEDPETGDTQRPNSEFSRGVEYALDPDNGEAVFVRQHCSGNTCDRVSRSQGHIHRMDSGHWLISWGRGTSSRVSDASVTEVDPLTNEELLAFKITHPDHYAGPNEAGTTRAYPVEFVALADTPGPLTAEIVESPASSLFHLGPTDAPKVAVAFSRPVVDFAADTTSVSVTGATIAGISPHVAPGDPANAYLFTLTPTGVGPISFALVAGQPCASDGICTADGTVLTEVPDSHIIPARSTGPVVASITSSATHPTKDGFTVTITFSELVMGLEASEIAVTNGRGSNFTGAGAVYTLEITPNAGIEDDVRVTVTAGAVVDALSNGNLAASEVFPVDTKAPVVSTVAITSNPGPDAIYAPGDVIEVTVTFDEAVVVTGRPGLSLTVGAQTKPATYDRGSNSETLVFAYPVASGDLAIDGVSIATGSIDRNGGTIRDGVNHDAVLDHEALAADSSHKVDGVKPELAVTGGAVVDGATLTLTWNETLDGGSTPETDDFTVAGADHVRTVTRVAVRGATVELTLDSGADHEEAGITVSYTPGTNPIRDAVGNDALGLSNETVRNDTPDTAAPMIDGIEITSSPGTNQTYGVGDVIEVTVTFDETVAVTKTPQLRLEVGSRNRPAGYLRGSGTSAPVFGYEVALGDEDTDGVSIAAGRIDLNGGTIQDGADNDAVLDHDGLAADAAHRMDGVKPVFQSAAVNEAELTLTYGEALDGSSRPGTGDFTVNVEGAERSVTNVAVSGSAVELTLDPAVEHGETGIRVSYSPGTNPIRDAVGNDALGLSNEPVTNTTGAPNTAPEITSRGPFEVTENQARVTRLTARDVDPGDEVTGWAIVGGVDRSQFTVASDTGDLSFQEAPDYEFPTDVVSSDPPSGAEDNEYVVTARVTSGAGDRELTAEQVITVRVSNEREPPGVPEAPTFSGETEDSLRVSWREPDNSGPPITDYDVQYRDGDSGVFTDAQHESPALTAMLTGLKEGTVYQVQVRASNEEGRSNWSEPGEGRTIVPLRVQMTTDPPTPVEGPFTFRFSFSEAVRGFTSDDIATQQEPPCTDSANNPVSCDPTITALQTTDDRIFTTTVAPRTASVAHNYTLTISVRANRVTSVVDNRPNEAATIAVRVAPPGVTVPISSIGLTASTGNGRVTLRWNAPQNIGGAPIVRYEYRWTEPGGMSGDWIRVAPVERAATVPNLTNGREYVFEVRGVNALGYGGVETVQTTPSPPPGGGGPPPVPNPVPSAPRNLEAVGGDEQVTLSWEAPEDDGGFAIADYQYLISRSGRGWISTGSTETTHTVTELVNGRLYVLQVRAVSGAGAGSSSHQIEVTPGVGRLEFAHFANGSSITSNLVLVNVAPHPIRPWLYFYNREGQRIAAESVVELTEELEIAEDGSLTVQSEMQPLQALTISTHGQGEVVAGSVTVLSNGPIGGVLRFDLPGGGVAGVGAGQPLRDALFPARRQEGGISTAAAIRNLEEEELVVSCRLMQEGAVLEEVDIELQAKGQDGRFIEEVFTTTDTSDFVGMVRCTAPAGKLFAGVAVELDAGHGIFTTLPVLPVDRTVFRGGEYTLDFAHFANGASITSDLVLVNVSIRPSRPAGPFTTPIPPTRPSFYFYDRAGERIAAQSVLEVTGELEVAEDGGLTIQNELEPLEAVTISTHGQGEVVAGSVRVVAEGPIGGVLRFDLPGVGVAGVGTGQPLTDALFPARRQEGGISTAAAIRNLEAEELVVSCQLMKEGEVLEEEEITLEVNGQDGRFIEEVFTRTDTTDFVGLVRCTAEGEFTGVAVELDAGNGIFTTLPVVPVER